MSNKEDKDMATPMNKILKTDKVDKDFHKLLQKGMVKYDKTLTKLSKN